jgi:hypothetical protein
MRAWNLALRFGLEVAAFLAIGSWVWAVAPSGLKWVASVVTVVIVVAVWGTFNVLDDPSRSGRAPVEVGGWVRLCLEIVILGGSAVALAGTGRVRAALWVGALTIFHYVVSWQRLRWLLRSSQRISH